MGEEFLSQHAGDIMEWLGNPSLRNELTPLLQLSQKEAVQLSQSAGGDFLQMLRMAEFKVAFKQLSKLGPDLVKVFRFSDEGIEVGVEKNLAVKLYPGIRKGTVVEFEFARGNVVLKGFLTYAEDRTIGEAGYLVFSFKAEERIPSLFELLKEDLQVIPGKQVEKSLGFKAFSLSNGKLSLDKGSLSMDGSVRFSDGMVLRLEDPGIRLVASENPLETGTLNKMLFQGSIGGTNVIVGEEGSVAAFHGGSYLPAVVTASSLSLQLGLLAKPSGEALTISRESLTANGIQDLSLLNVVYPNGETSTLIYTGGSLQIPTLSYASGAFVGIQAVEIKIAWTSINEREFYSQIASMSEILGGVLGRAFAEELVKTLLLSGLTDSQALDIANELVRNLEWLKTLSEKERIDIVKRIAEYVKKGETAEEARERVEKENEEYAKDLNLRIISFCQSILDAQLANEVEDLIRHVLESMGPRYAEWLLETLRNVYYRALAESKGDRGLANSKLRSVVEKVFKYPESKMHSCRLASTKVSQLMRLEEEILKEILEEALSSEGGEISIGKFEIRIPKSGYITHTMHIESGLYLVRATRKEDGKVFEWSTEIEEDRNRLVIKVPKRFKDELAEKGVVIEIIRYDYSIHFKSRGPNFYFSPSDGLIVEGKRIEIEKVESWVWCKDHGASMRAKLKERSIEGAEIHFVFYEDGHVSILSGEIVHPATLRIEEDMLIIEYISYRAIVPIIAQEWVEGKEYYLNIPVEGKKRLGLVQELRKKFGYHNTEKLRKKINEGELALAARFDNGVNAYCRNEKLMIGVPEDAKVLEYVIVLHTPKSWSELSDEDVDRIKGLSKTELGDEGGDRFAVFAKDSGIAEVGEPESIWKKVGIVGGRREVDLVIRTRDNKLIIAEVKSSKTSEDYLGEYIENAFEQLRDYKELIEKYGLDLTKYGCGIEKGENIAGYLAAFVFFDLENKEVKITYEWLPEG
ncbi:MAG: hypothetical protein QXO75_09670 [Nitrososphaerota archaeon]